MSVHDIKRPYMVYEGPRPRNAATPASVAPNAGARLGEVEADREKMRDDAKLAIVLSIVGALGLGMGIGVWMTPMLGDNNPFLAPPAQAAPLAMTATLPASTTTPILAAPDAAPAVEASQEPVASETVAAPAEARRADPPRKIKVAARTDAPVRTAGGCSPNGSRAAVTLCTDPAIAAADQDMERAFQRALRSGAPAKTLRAEQQAWLSVREDAAGRSPADLADVYEQRVAELNAIADDPPH